jgi:hypothetical protein
MPNPDEITRYCSSLVIKVLVKEDLNMKDNEHAELQLAHFSVKEYLTSKRLDNSIAHDLQEITSRASISRVCLAYLLHFNHRFLAKELLKRFPFARYSARFWMEHAALAGLVFRFFILIKTLSPSLRISPLILFLFT